MKEPIYAELSLHEHLRKALAAEYETIDEETLSDTIEGLTLLSDKLCAITKSLLDDRSLATALRHRIDEMKDRLQRLESRADKKKELVIDVMDRGHLKKLTDPEFTVSLRSSPPKLVISDETIIPPEFWRPQPPKLDRQALLTDLKDGGSPPGVNLSNGAKTISIRTN
jgi:hypothetical protein